MVDRTSNPVPGSGEVCVGCAHPIGMHFNDVLGVARCLVTDVSHPFGIRYEVGHCQCANFEMPKPTSAPPPTPRPCGCVGGQFCRECY